MSVLEYFTKYENFKIPKCKFCKNDAKLIKGLNFLKFCSRKCRIAYINTIKNKNLEQLKNKILEFEYLFFDEFKKYCLDNNLPIRKTRKIFKDNNIILRKRLTQEHKNKISIARRKNLMKKSGMLNTTWSRKLKNHLTYPEKLFAELIIENKLFERYDIINEYSFYK